MGAGFSRHSCSPVRCVKRNGYRGKKTTKQTEKVTKPSENSSTFVNQGQCKVLSSQNEPQDPPPPFTDDEKFLLKSTWAKIEQDAAVVGPMTFVNLFEKHPVTSEDLLRCKSTTENEGYINKIVRNHGLRVLNTVRKMISRIDQEEKMLEMVEATGDRHVCYNAEAALIDVMCPHFMKAIAGSLGDSWNPEVEEAYRHLFVILAYYMKKQLAAVETSGQKESSSSKT